MKPSRNDPCPCGSGKKFKHCCESKQVARATLPSAELNQLGMLLNSQQFTVLEVRASGLLEHYPNEAGLWKFLAMSLQMQGKDGLTAFQKTADLLPNDAGVQMNLGNALQDAGQLDEAVQSYQRALAIKPTFAEAHNNLGATFATLGQLEESVASYRRAVQIKPDFAAAHNGLGGVLRDLGQLDEAVASYRRAIKVQPNYAEAHNNLGVTLRDLGQFDQAMMSYRQVLKIQPDYAAVHSNLGVVLRDLGKLEDAISSFHQALAIQPDDAQTLNNLGLCYKEVGLTDKSIASYRRAIECDPKFATAYSNLGDILKSLRQYNEALANYRIAITLQPSFVEAHVNLGSTQADLGQFREAQLSFRHALKIHPDLFIAHNNLLLCMNYTAQSPAEYLSEAKEFGKTAASKVTAQFVDWQCSPRPNRLRTGIISGDLRHHSVGYFIESLLALLDPARIELIAYTTQPHEDDLTARIKTHFRSWKPIFTLSDQTAAQLIHDDGIHVLLDLSGHTAHNRLPLFAWKPAPVQVTWLGLPTTTGVAEMDYVIGDPIATPAEDTEHFCEQIWRLPETYICLSHPDTTLTVNTLPALSNGYVTFASFNNLAKMNDATVAVWARILEAIPTSKLLLKAKQLRDTGANTSTLERFAAHGIAAERLILAQPTTQRSDHLATYHRVDIALDPFPYPGVTTSAEALWMGIPVLTLRGDRFVSRTAASIAHNVGLPDWIARNEDDYISKAVHFAADFPKLATLRANLREQVRISPLFDAPRFAKHFEEALWGMWQARRNLI